MKPFRTSAAIAALAFAAAPAFSQQQEVSLLTESAVASEEDLEFLTVEEEAAAEFEREMAEAFAMFGDLFVAEPLDAEQQARLPLAQKMTDQVFPEGSFSVVMEQGMAPMMTAMMGAATSDPRTQLAQLTGLAPDDLGEVTDENARAALDVLDPQYAARNERVGEILVEMMNDMFAALEPAYRDALSRAFAVRFESDEMEELLVFFDTPVGGKFARESILVQYDPQMMAMMEAMGPAMGEVLPKMLGSIAEMAEDYPDGRIFNELSEAERARISALLGKGEAELEALAPEREADEDELREAVT